MFFVKRTCVLGKYFKIDTFEFLELSRFNFCDNFLNIFGFYFYGTSACGPVWTILVCCKLAPMSLSSRNDLFWRFWDRRQLFWIQFQELLQTFSDWQRTITIGDSSRTERHMGSLYFGRQKKFRSAAAAGGKTKISIQPPTNIPFLIFRPRRPNGNIVSSSHWMEI